MSLTRPYVLFTTTSFYLTAAFLSINRFPPLVPLFVGFIAVAFAIASAHTLNDYFDTATDKDNPRTAKRAIPSGEVSQGLALALGMTYGVTAIFFTFLLNTPSVILGFMAIPLPFVYNLLRKREIPYSFLCTMLAVLFIILLGSTAITGQYFSAYILLFVIFGVTWEAGRTLISEVQDVDHDKTTNVTTISVVISSKHATQLSLLLFSIASIMSIVIGILGQLGLIYLGVALIASGWLIYRSLELVRTPTQPKAICMLSRAPKYLVIICLVIVISILVNVVIFGL